MQQGGFPNALTNLKELRELEFTSVGPGAFVTLPEGISNWQQLRDLQLYRCGLEKLPESISMLQKLDTLLMEGFRYLRVLMHAHALQRFCLSERIKPGCIQRYISAVSVVCCSALLTCCSRGGL